MSKVTDVEVSAFSECFLLFLFFVFFVTDTFCYGTEISLTITLRLSDRIRFLSKCSSLNKTRDQVYVLIASTISYFQMIIRFTF